MICLWDHHLQTCFFSSSLLVLTDLALLGDLFTAMWMVLVVFLLNRNLAQNMHRYCIPEKSSIYLQIYHQKEYITNHLQTHHHVVRDHGIYTGNSRRHPRHSLLVDVSNLNNIDVWEFDQNYMGQHMLLICYGYVMDKLLNYILHIYIL